MGNAAVAAIIGFVLAFLGVTPVISWAVAMFVVLVVMDS